MTAKALMVFIETTISPHFGSPAPDGALFVASRKRFRPKSRRSR